MVARFYVLASVQGIVEALCHVCELVNELAVNNVCALCAFVSSLFFLCEPIVAHDIEASVSYWHFIQDVKWYADILKASEKFFFKVFLKVRRY